MNTATPVSRFLVAFITGGLGLYVIWRGWTMMRDPAAASPTLFQLLAVKLAHIVQGEKSATRKRAELMQPDRVRRSGLNALIVGSLLLIGGCLQIVGWIWKIINL